MAIPNTTKREIRPTHPGEMLREDFMPDYDLNTTSMANALGVSRQTINEILRALAENEISLDLINERVEKVLEYKAKIAQDVLNYVESDYEKVNLIVNNQVHNEISQNVYNNALTLVSGKRFAERGNVLLIAPQPVATTIADDTVETKSLLTAVKKEFPKWDVLELKIKPTESECLDIIEKSKNYEQIIFCSYNANIYASQNELINKLKSLNNLHLIALRNPYDVIGLNDIDCLCIYEYTPKSIKTIIKYLKGDIEPKGSLPVRI